MRKQHARLGGNVGASSKRYIMIILAVSVLTLAFVMVEYHGLRADDSKRNVQQSYLPLLRYMKRRQTLILILLRNYRLATQIGHTPAPPTNQTILSKIGDLAVLCYILDDSNKQNTTTLQFKWHIMQTKMLNHTQGMIVLLGLSAILVTNHGRRLGGMTVSSHIQVRNKE